MERREIAGQASLGWTAAIGSAIARQSAKEDDSNSEGVSDLTEREMSSSDEEEMEREKRGRRDHLFCIGRVAIPITLVALL